MATKKNVDYKTLQAELDGILERLQHGEPDIDEATEGYERGMQLITELEAYIKDAENKVTKLQAKLKDIAD